MKTGQTKIRQGAAPCHLHGTGRMTNHAYKAWLERKGLTADRPGKAWRGEAAAGFAERVAKGGGK